MSDLEFRKNMEFAYGVPRELAPGVQRVVANNPSIFTFRGTNTYVIGSKGDLAVIDPGPDDDAHYSALMSLIGDRKVSHIAVTHTHRDHVDGLGRFAAATGAQVCGFGRTAHEAGKLRKSPSGAEFIDLDFKPDLKVEDGDVLTGSDWTLEAIFTPGHAPDHLCFALREQDVLFSGDHVMGWNTTVVAPPEGHMADYMASLERLVKRTDSIYLPGHGGQIAEPQKMTRAYLVHRRLREQAILGAIRSGHKSIREIVGLIYTGLDERLVAAASLSVQAHVEDLAERGLILAELPLDFESTIYLN
ncbi:MAG: MBL fold metallo-hydrolase [Hyphomicrobiaceae bacterium]